MTNFIWIIEPFLRIFSVFSFFVFFLRSWVYLTYNYVFAFTRYHSHVCLRFYLTNCYLLRKYREENYKNIFYNWWGKLNFCGWLHEMRHLKGIVTFTIRSFLAQVITNIELLFFNYELFGSLKNDGIYFRVPSLGWLFLVTTFDFPCDDD